MQNIKKILTIATSLLLCIFLLFLLFGLSKQNKIFNLGASPTQETSVVQITSQKKVSAATLIESKGLNEFDSNTNYKALSKDGNHDLAPEEKIFRDKGFEEASNEQYNDAITDLTKAIEIRKNHPIYEALNDDFEYLLYWGRAEAYVNTDQKQNAITDYTKTISILFTSQIILTNIATIRSLYPEFNDITDRDLLEGLGQKYYPTLSGFVEYVLKNNTDGRKEDWKKDLTKVYLARGDAYRRIGDTRNAALDYRRAIRNSPETTLNLGDERRQILEKKY